MPQKWEITFGVEEVRVTVVVSPTKSRGPAVPQLVVALSLVSGVAAIFMLFIGASRVGVTWDERVHAAMTQTFFQTGWYASPDWLVDGNLDSFTGKWPYFVYAPVASLFAHGIAVLMGGEPWGGFSDSAAAYTGRHVGTAILALIGIAVTGLIVRAIIRSWSWAILSIGLLAATPMWVGHGMFNVKDLPVAVGYTAATLGFVLVLRRRYSRMAAWLTISSGLILAVGTRPASGLPVVLTGLLLALGALIINRGVTGSDKYASRRLPERATDILGSMVLSYLVLWLIYPNAFGNPFRLAKESLLISGRFPVIDPELTAGIWLQQPPPWYYLPTWFGAQLPLVVLIALVFFAFYWVVAGYALFHRKKPENLPRDVFVLSAPVIAQTLLLPLLAVGVGSTIYDAVRQFLFVVPAAVVLATIGIWALASSLAQRRGLELLLWAAVGLGIAIPTIEQLRLFPYNYVYFNEVASVRPINGNWATDYWRASSRELVTQIPPGETSCRFVSDTRSVQPCNEDASFAPFWDSRGESAVPGALDPNEYWFVRENGGDVSAPPGCLLHDELRRPLGTQQVIIAQIFKCSPA